MKCPKDMTPDELRDLPLVSDLEYREELDPVTHHTVSIRNAERLHAADVQPDAIHTWIDQDGTWSPVYLGDDIGWAKLRVASG